MLYCSNCGKQHNEGAKFCSKCGTPISTTNKDSSNQRKVLYEGKIHKCPNCGEVLESFIIQCPSCGYEFRDSQVSSSVKEFANKLAELEESKKDSKFDVLGIGKMFKERCVLNATDEKIVSLIKNFSIPNTKEDLFEFLILSSSNIDDSGVYNGESKQAISDAWKSKFEQAYEKARISFGDSADFKKVQEIHDKKCNEIKRGKTKYLYTIVGICILFVLIMCLLIFFAFFDTNGNAIEKENQRLESIVQEVYDEIEEKNYTLAKAKASTVVFSGSSDEEIEKWNTIREQLMQIIAEESNTSYKSEENDIKMENRENTDSIENSKK